MRTPHGLGVAYLVLGVMLLQIAWIAAVPPFRGSDEFEHAYRAAGVAHGQWRLTEPVAGARGELVFVPPELVAAANGQCEALRYTERGNCNPVADGPGNLVGVATAAGSYNPLYYAVVGAAGLPFDGSSSLYAMRVSSAFLCLLLIMAAAFCASPLLQGTWSRLGLYAGLTPTLVYSTSVLGPNGLEMAAGLCVWASLTGLGAAGAAKEPSVRREQWLFLVATFSGSVLVTLRTLGPVWLFMIVACCLLVYGVGAAAAVVRRHWVAFGSTLGCVTLAMLASLGANPPGSLIQEGDPSPRWTMALRLPEWIIGALGTFPYRNQPAPAPAIALGLLVLTSLLVLGVAKARGRGRVGLLAGVAGALLVPVVIVAATLAQTGGGWQGRYALPFMVGLVPLAGMLLDISNWRPPVGHRIWLLIGAAMLTVAQGIGVVSVLKAEQKEDASRLDTSWLAPSWLALVLLVLAAGACFSAYLLKGRSPVGVCE